MFRWKLCESGRGIDGFVYKWTRGIMHQGDLLFFLFMECTLALVSSNVIGQGWIFFMGQIRRLLLEKILHGVAGLLQ